jgi:hypothetical protein
VKGIREEGVGATEGLQAEVSLRTVAAAADSADAATAAVALQETSPERVRIRNR